MAEQYSSYARELRAGRPVMAQTVGDSMQPLLYQGRTQAVLHGLCYSIHGECVVLSVWFVYQLNYNTGRCIRLSSL